MAITVYRFRWQGCDAAAIKSSIDPAVASVVTNAMAKAWMDVSLDPGDPGSAAESDLKAVMLSMGWIPFATNPLNPLRAVTKKQEIFASVATDVSTTSNAFVDLISTPIDTDAGFVDVSAMVSSEALAALAYFRITLDGVAIVGAGAGASHSVGVAGNAIQARAAVAQGAHTVALQWRAGVLGTVNINAATDPDGSSASLFVAEVVS